MKHIEDLKIKRGSKEICVYYLKSVNQLFLDFKNDFGEVVFSRVYDIKRDMEG